MMLSCSPLVNKTILLNTVCVCVGGSKTSALRWGGWGGGGHPDPEIRGGPPVSQFFFSALRASHCSNIKGGGTGWIRY